MDTIELKETTSIRINKSLLDRMRAKAKAGNRTFSNLVETLLYEFDDAEDDKKSIMQKIMREGEDHA